MNTKLNLKNVITSLKKCFTDTGVRCVKEFFEKECEILVEWEVVEQLHANFDIILTMGSSNSKYSALTIAGIQNDSLCAFLDKSEVKREEALDVLGEFINSFCGLLADNKEFSDNFGIFSQSVPVLYTDGESLIPFIWGIQGYLYIKEHWIYVGYTVRDNSLEMVL